MATKWLIRYFYNKAGKNGKKNGQALVRSHFRLLTLTINLEHFSRLICRYHRMLSSVRGQGCDSREEGCVILTGFWRT